jgi:ABC-2 type transport system permease protein
MEGSSVLSETLANYSAMVMLTRLRGEDETHRGLQQLRDRYLSRRAAGRSVKEPPLARVETESWITYQKGAHVMHLLQARLGEERVNRALRRLLQRYRFKGAPYPRSLDLVQALREEARTEEEQNLITDVFERVILYDLKVSEPTAVRRADGKWDVTVPIEAKKYAVDERGAEKETPLAEPIQVGLFDVDPVRNSLDTKSAIAVEYQPIRSGAVVLRFVTEREPTHAAIDPYNYYIDRNSRDNVASVSKPRG